MNEAERIAEWARFFKASQPSYRANALLAVFENGGEKMLSDVCKALKLNTAADLVREMR